MLWNAALKAHATPLEAHTHRFEPFGVSGIVIVSESHLAIHTWPEYHYAQVDIFTCGSQTDPLLALSYIAGILQPKAIEKLVLDRGNLDLITFVRDRRDEDGGYYNG